MDFIQAFERVFLQDLRGYCRFCSMQLRSELIRVVVAPFPVVEALVARNVKVAIDTALGVWICNSGIIVIIPTLKW